jgi:hypothetical protein
MPNKSRTKFYNWLVQHYVATYGLMVALFLTFSLLSLDLFRIYSANVDYILENGIEGLRDGGFEQLLGLVVTTLCSVLAYLGFKLCENALIFRASHRLEE